MARSSLTCVFVVNSVSAVERFDSVDFTAPALDVFEAEVARSRALRAS